jgi:ankyrin repeat protein
VKLQLELLISEEYRIDSKEEFNRRLARLSSGSSENSSQKLSQTYRDILKRNLENQGDQSAKSAEEALKWVACSAEPLPAQTLLEAVKMNTKDNLTDKQLWKWCRNLLEVDATGIMRFTHLSVREFVESEESLRGAHALAALTCLQCARKPSLRRMYPKLGIYALLFRPFHCGHSALAADWYTTAIGTEAIRFLTPEILTAVDIEQKTGYTPNAVSMLREIWISEAKSNGATRDTKLGLTMIHDGSQLLPDDFLMACYLNWQWLLNDIKSTEITKYNEVQNTRQQRGLHLAIKQGHFEIVRFLLQHGVDPDSSDSEYTSPLGAAILSNQPGMVKLLLGIDSVEFESDPQEEITHHRSRANVNANGYWHRNTALHLAALYNLPEVAEGINPNIQNGKGATALFDSAVVGSREVARILINRDDLDLRLMGLHLDGNHTIKHSALHVTESPEMAKMLLDRDPELCESFKRIWTVCTELLAARKRTYGPFADAAYERDLVARLDVLLACKKLDSRVINSALQEPACMQSVPVLKRLWDDPRLASPEVWQDASGNTLLHKAVATGNAPVIKFLLDHGVEPTSLNNIGETALEVAQRHSRDDLAALLK